jgi:hypothetical protein
MYDSWVKKGECRFDQIWLMGFSDLTPVITVVRKQENCIFRADGTGAGKIAPQTFGRITSKTWSIKVKIFLETHKNLNQSSTLFVNVKTSGRLIQMLWACHNI